MFHALLFSYYICEAAAGAAVLDPGAAYRCSAIYEDVKAQFLSEEELAELRSDPRQVGGGHGRSAFRRFRAWEAENPALVGRLRTEAQAQLVSGVAGF